MSSFYSLVRKSVGDLSERSEREAIYERSRKALRTMQAQSSAFSTEQIEGQTRDLEQAIARVEQEVTAAVPESTREQLPLPKAIPPAVLPSSSAVKAERDPTPNSRRPGAILPSKNRRAPGVGWIGKIRPDRRLGKRDNGPAARPVERPKVAGAKSRSMTRILLVGAAAFAFLVVPLGLWFSFSTPVTTSIPETSSANLPAQVETSAPVPTASENAWLDRGDVRAGGALIWQSEAGLYGGDRAAGFRVSATFEPDDRYAAGLRVAIAMTGNVSPVTPAAQIAEIRFTTKDDQPIAIADAGGILIRKDDSSAGSPLLGLTAKADVPGLFILGTSPLKQDADANKALMRGAKWIDVPFVEADGAAAIVSIPVEQNPILQTALNGWSAP